MNAMAASEEYRPESYGWQWLAIILAAALFGSWLWWRSEVRSLSIPPPPPAPVGRADWFFIIRLPEVPEGSVATDIAQKQLDRWIGALVKEGFKPILLSKAYDNLKHGRKLPDKSIVLLFDPGSRHTYQAVAPVLAKHEVPAVWLTDGESLRRRDRRYISLRQAREMAESGWWDVGFNEPPGQIVLQSHGGAQVTLSNKKGSMWGPQDGKLALNHMSAWGKLNRLNVNGVWSSQELLDRISTEKPLRGKSYLTLRHIQSMRWGVVEPFDGHPREGFEMLANRDRLGSGIYWLGTRGHRDIQIDLQVSSLIGELWLLLRSDERDRESVRVAFSNQQISIEEQTGGERQTIARKSVPQLRQPGSFAATVKLKGDQVDVWVAGQHCATASHLSVAGSPDSVVRLMIYDKVTGAARAGSVAMTATPLAPISDVSPALAQRTRPELK